MEYQFNRFSIRIFWNATCNAFGFLFTRWRAVHDCCSRVGKEKGHGIASTIIGQIVVCIKYLYGLMRFFWLNQIWDCQKMKCVATLKGHADDVNVVFSCPEFPVLITGSMDGSIRLWNSNTFRYAPRPYSYKSTNCIRL